MPHHVRRGATALLAAAVALTGLVATGSTSSAAPPVPKPRYTIEDPAGTYADNCATRTGTLTPLPGAGGPSRVVSGIAGGASYQIEVPASWNGELVLYAHGFNGDGTRLCVQQPALRAYYLSQGYAWAASSYATNGYDVAQGVKDTHRLLGVFQREVAKPYRVYLTGVSMGGHITAVAIEQYRSAFDGAMPVCGVLGDSELFDYFLDVNVTAAALAGAPKPPFPTTPAAYTTYVNTQVAPQLGVYGGKPPLAPVSAAGQAWGEAVQQLSGGPRPGFDASFSFWNAFGFGALPNVPFLFGVYPGLTGGTIGQSQGSVVGNTGTVYQLDSDPAVSPAEVGLNAAVLRVAEAPQGRRPQGLAGIPVISGDLRIPVLTLHDLGDLFVPFSMEQVYARRVAAHGDSALLTQRAIRGTDHCDFTAAEMIRGFTDLVAQVETGVKPAGDDVLTPSVLAAPTYGCRFTTAVRAPFFPACPPA